MTEEPKHPLPRPYKETRPSHKAPQYGEISPEKLREILKQHQKWVKTGGKGGEKAKLQEANLQKANLRGANLENAVLVRANLQEANLRSSHLQKAWLGEANLQKANFYNATFREAHLHDADLTGATGLLASQFAGANVSGAKLPKDIHEFKGVEQVEKISQRAQKLFLSILLGCVYCWLTIAITTDVGLITNSGSSPLPIIQTKIPIAGFYWAAPLILLSLYFWFHLYLQRLWERLSQLPAVFPDGEALDEKVYPWLISGMVRSHVRLLKEHRPALSRIQTGISVLLAWWIIPFTFLLFWLRYIPRHDWVGTSLHVIVLVFSITAAILLHRLAAKTLRGERASSLSWKEKVKSLPAYQHASLTVGILGLSGIIFFHLSTWAIEGVRPSLFDFARYSSINSWEDLSKPPPESTSLKWHEGRILLPRLFDYFGYRTYANLVEADISTKPPTWTGQADKLKDEIPLVKGAKLNGANFQNANMEQAFLINADLRRAHLQGADLELAHLEKADLFEADLQKANLLHAHLEQAYLLGADLQKANLFGAHLEKANLAGAHLENADLREAHLEKADLAGAHLEKADLRGVYLGGVKNLTQAQLNQACVDENTTLPKGLTRPEPCSKKDLPKKGNL